MFSSCFQIQHEYFNESNQRADRKCEDKRNEMEVNDRKTHWVRPFLVHSEFNVIGWISLLLIVTRIGRTKAEEFAVSITVRRSLTHL